MKRTQIFLFFLLILTDVILAQRNPEITAKELKWSTTRIDRELETAAKALSVPT